jgi:pimeloyl-ACP methyl ester carboxylesterase
MHKLLLLLFILFSCAHSIPDKQREVLILIHGHADYAGSWKMWESVLEKKYQVYAIDLPGYNHHDAHKFNHASMDDLIQELWRRIDNKSLGQVTIVGHDVGAYMAFRLAHSKPLRVKQIVSFNMPHPQNYFTWYQRHQPDYIKNYLALKDFSKSDLSELYSWKRTSSDYQKYLQAMQKTSSPAMLNYYHQIFSEDSLRLAWNSSIKCLTLGGANDPAVPILAFKNSLCDQVTVNSAAHDLHTESPVVIQSTVLNWLAGKLSFKHFHLIDEQLAKSYIAKFDSKQNIYAIGDPLVKFSSEHYLKKEIIKEHTNAIDFLITNDDKVLLASDFTAPKDNNGIGRLLELSANSSKEIARIPNLHRMVWLDHNRTQFIAAAIFSANESSPTFDSTPAEIFHFVKNKKSWKSRKLDSSLHLLHGIKADLDNPIAFYTASWEGVHHWTFVENKWKHKLIYAGDQQNGFQGSSEVLALDDLLVAIGPWHGDRLSFIKNKTAVKVYTDHKQGHGLAQLDVDRDGKLDVIGCFMGKNAGVYWFETQSLQFSELPILNDFKCEGITSEKQSLLITGESQLIKIDF